ncbi:MAG: transcriptional regulator [Candidatus Aenigmarchaeota archaeon]|nr:transcriptional regulator [Candidatus Aenigmarchaeota archaeon]
MTEFTDDEKKVVEAMKSLGAKSDDKLKDVDSIAKASLMPKGKVANIILGLVNRKVVKRIAREKAAGYYLIASV